LVEHPLRARHGTLLAANEHAISVQSHDDRNERFKRREVLIELTENAQRIDRSSELENFLAGDLLDG
jgi:hypothetical protein